ncbi:MAG: hypothetical protein H7X88_04650 [Gloeobacteraceae cyanobacterium ES-bin-316]|nr:hypothetical protein [Ferruginibacter sp.]
MKKKRISTLLLCLLAGLFSFAQTEGYKYKTNIDSIKEAGFYNIVLGPEINARLKTDYSDLRIINSTGKWVPHLVRLPANEQTNQGVRWDLSILKKESTAAFTEIVIASPKKEIDNLTFRLTNTDVERYCTLTGSDDSTNWFIINDSITIKPFHSEEKNISTFTLQFPPNVYKFYKAFINNKGRAPYNILRVSNSSSAGNFIGDPSLVVPLQNPAAAITQKDSAKLSYILIKQKASYHVNKIELKLSGVKYFSRRIDLHIPQSRTHNFTNPGLLIKSFTVSNNSTLQFSVPVFKDSIFYLIIYNEDNLPLQMDAVNTYAGLYVATVYLEKEKNYSLLLGNENAAAPNYDLQELNLKIDSLPTAYTGKLETLKSNDGAASNSWMNNKWLVWITIAAGGILLTFFTYKLVKDINKK